MIPAEQRVGLGGGDFAIEDLELIDLPTHEAAVAVALSEHDVLAGTARGDLHPIGNRVGEVVFHDAGSHRLAVEVELQTCRPARAIVAERHVLPCLGGERFDRLNAKGIARPEVNERRRWFPVDEQEFVAHACGIIRPGTATEHILARHDMIGLKPN